MEDRGLWLATCVAGFGIGVAAVLLSPGSPQHLLQASGVLVGGAVAQALKPGRGTVQALLPKATELVEKGNLYIDPRRVAARMAYNLQSALVVASCFLAVWILSAIFLGFKLEAVLALAPLPIPLLKTLYVDMEDKVRERRERAERELPFFASLVAILTLSLIHI